jgi:choline transport protein
VPRCTPKQSVTNNLTGNVGASVLSALVIVMAMFCNLSITATASRQLFAFARDQGVPFASWFANVRPGWDVPVNSIIVSFVVSCLLSIINIGSTIALNNITSLSLCAIISSYLVSIGLVFWRRITNRPLLPAPFTLSKPIGLVLNAVSLAFLMIAFVFSFFPGTNNPNAEQMNWAILIYGAVMVFALMHYFISARHVYDGPVEYVRKL